MMSIQDKFKQLKKDGKKAFIVYIPFGFPHPRYTKDILLALQDTGVDIVELGIPFSDPLADGPIIQKASSRALENGANQEKMFATLQRIRSFLKTPMVIMTYYNPLFMFGVKKFFRRMNELGVSGITVVDLPLEESSHYIKEARQFDLETVFFITPTTHIGRAKKICRASRGFIYYISVTGITGPKSFSYAPLLSHIKILKNITRLPLCVGFGIHTRTQAEQINKFSDGIIVGSSIVKFIAQHYHDKDFLRKLKKYVNSFVDK
ncbi:MAG: tryptophan synthase subunit alpha [Candidatus Omnitrophota bacterium]|nr:MAG: tryptophan synthase subunit alpha [Candidatus Omnitrophota bacterium]